MATVPGGEIERYVVWLRNLLAEHDASGADSRALLPRIVADLAAGRQTICGAFIPSEVIGSLATQLLPELEAALDQRGGPLPPPRRGLSSGPTGATARSASWWPGSPSCLPSTRCRRSGPAAGTTSAVCSRSGSRLAPRCSWSCRCGPQNLARTPS